MKLRSLILLMCSVPPSVAAETLTLVDAYQSALQNGSIFSAAQSEKMAAIEDLPQARSALRPNLSIISNYALEDYERDYTTLEKPITSSSLHLRLKQPLYDRPAWYRVARAEDKIKVDVLRLEEKRQQIAYDVSEAYLGEILKKEAFYLAKAERESYLKQWERVNNSVQLGLASRVDLLESKARLDTADAQVLKSENEWREAKRKLHKIIGGERGLQAGVDSQQLPTEADALLQLKELEFKLDDVSYWVDASSENIQRRMAVLGVQLMKSDRNIAIAGRYPTLTFSADLENSRHDDPTVLEGSRSKVGFELIIPLLDGGRTTSSIRKAEARTTQAEEELRDSIETTELNVRTVLDLLRNDRANIDAMALSVESAAALLQAVEESHKVGLKDLGSVLDAKAGLYATKRRMAEAVYTAILHRLQLNQAVGHLSERELKVIDRWLVN